MQVLGYRSVYSGEFGDTPVIQAGGFKLIDLKNVGSKMPLGLLMLTTLAKQSGADFLVIDPEAKTSGDSAEFVDVREAA